MRASDILEALKRKHAEDIFVPQCKTGPSYGNQALGIFDAWVMLKSWAHSNFIGYEIKVDRSDFVNDNKWPKYLPYCNPFYFVCPKDVIKESEVPEGAGLYYCSLPSYRLLLKRKAPRREIDVPAGVFMYILMCRVKVTGEIEKGSEKVFWEDWLKERKLDRDLGYRVSKALKETISKEIDAAKRTNRDLEYEVEKYKRVLDTLKELGVDPKMPEFQLVREIRRKWEQFKVGCPEGWLDTLNRAITALTVVRNRLSGGPEG
jgi:hypothetical protein